MIHIDIRSIRHRSQRYPTSGDWQRTPMADLGLKIKVSRLDPLLPEHIRWKYELLIAFHELVEAALCKVRGVSERDVDAFDIAFEEDRKLDANSVQGEPGDDPQAPYYREHQFATLLEKLMAIEMEVNWQHYEQSILDLDERSSSTTRRI